MHRAGVKRKTRFTVNSIMQRDLLEQRDLSRDELIALRNKRTGVTIFQISWIMVFVCLILVNLQMRGNFASWPPPGVAPLDPVLPTLATIGLLISTILTRAGLKAIQNDDQVGLRSRWEIAIGLGAAFIGVMAFVWLAIPFSGQFSTVFRVMVAYHAVHALVIGYIMFRVYMNAAAYDALHHWAVEAAAKLWYFVTVAWILFYIVLYIV
jgi:heme/copper-type cytochrome/quinol oxidase subunit 3